MKAIQRIFQAVSQNRFFLVIRIEHAFDGDIHDIIWQGTIIYIITYIITIQCVPNTAISVFIRLEARMNREK